MTDTPPPLHPRPRLTRERWIDLNGSWGFAYDDDDVGLDQRWYDDGARFTRSITVPFPPESRLSGIADTGFHPVLWYRRTFAAKADGGRMILHFGAVDYRAQVWVNGDLVATHEGGHTPFSADITALLDRYQAAIIDTRGGMFRLQFGGKAMAKDQIAGLMSRLQSEKIISLAVATP